MSRVTVVAALACAAVFAVWLKWGAHAVYRSQPRDRIAVAPPAPSVEPEPVPVPGAPADAEPLALPLLEKSTLDSGTWARDAAQTHDPILRAATLDRLLGALDRGTPADRWDALCILAVLKPGSVEDPRFRPLVVDSLDSPHAPTRKVARDALGVLSLSANDVALFASLARHRLPDVRRTVGPSLVKLCERRITEEAASILRIQLADADGEVVTTAIRSLRDVAMPPSLQSDLVALARDPERRIAVLTTLARIENKTEPTVRALIAALRDSDYEVRAAAIRFEGGIPNHLHGAVAAALVDLVRSHNYRDGLAALPRIVAFGGEADARALERWCTRYPDAGHWDGAREAARAIRRKLAAR